MDLDTALRRHVYGVIRDRGAPPTIDELTVMSAAPNSAVSTSLLRLAAARVFVLQPASGEILMAPPFSAIATPFVVRTTRHASYANCAWDALGVPVMLSESAQISASCGCCGEAITLQTDGRTSPAGSGVIHFAVPARRWWEDLVFT